MPGLTSCPGTIFNKRHGKFQEKTINLEEFNSDTDDYNSDLPSNRGGQEYIIFSSKRDRKNVFNLVVKPFEFFYDDKAEQLKARIGSFRGLHLEREEHYFHLLTQKANQNSNVLGPVIYSYDKVPLGSERYLLFFADDSKGNLQIKFVHNLTDKNIAEGPFEVSWLNSPFDDAYPTFTNDFSTLYFCSNRDGNFDIFEVVLPTDRTQLLETLLSNKPITVTKNTRLSSPADDKCPHFVPDWPGNAMYFVSNRPGGYGGFDIYYSLSASTSSVRPQWSTPKNLGKRINTAYDEYRPVVPRDRNYFTYHLGIFSSNRPGGKGGFDLYMAGFLKSKETQP
jgi:hypothetical protein